MTKIRGKPKNKNCLICGDLADGQHFDIDTCRACAAFFRRAICRTGKPYKCKQPKSCEKVTQCKACRLSTCLEQGMNAQAIQPSRDAIGKKTEKPPDALRGLLKRMVDNYEKVEQTRREVFDREELKFKPDAQALTLEESNKIFMADHYAILEWLLTSFPELRKLDASTLKGIFGHFYTSFFLLDQSFHHLKTGDKHRIITQTGDYIDTQNLSGFFAAISKNSLLTVNDLDKIFVPCFEKYLRNVVGRMEKLKIELAEILCILAFLVWDPGHPMMPEDMASHCTEIREQLSRELFEYEEHKRKEEAIVRVSQIITLLPAIEGHTELLRENFYLGRVFQIYEFSKKFYEIVNVE